MMTDTKHRVRSTRGARGSNPSQKTPRQRSARSALYLRTSEAKCVASYSKARFAETRKLTKGYELLFCDPLAMFCVVLLNSQFEQ